MHVCERPDAIDQKRAGEFNGNCGLHATYAAETSRRGIDGVVRLGIELRKSERECVSNRHQVDAGVPGSGYGRSGPMEDSAQHANSSLPEVPTATEPHRRLKRASGTHKSRTISNVQERIAEIYTTSSVGWEWNLKKF